MRPTKHVSRFPQASDLQTSTNELSAIKATYVERRRICEEIDKRVKQSKNSYLSIDAIKKIVMGTVVLICLLIPASIKADPLPINLVFVRGTNWIGENYIDLFSTDLIRYLKRETDIRIKVNSIYNITDPSAQMVELSQLTPKFRDLESYAKSKNLIKGAALVHFIAPPATQGGRYFIGGLAHDTCALFRKRRSYSISNAMLHNTDGDPRYAHSIIAAAHEITHLLGGQHIQTQSLMNPDALSLVSTYGLSLPISRATKRQIKNCIEIEDPKDD